MQGNTVGRSSGRSTVHYRCVYRTNYPGDEAHSRSLAVAERRMLPVLDAWLARLFDPDHIEETVDTLLRADRPADNDPPPLIEARRLATDAETRLARHVAAIDAGVDPSILVAQTREAQADLARANAIIAAHTARATMTALTPSAIRAVLLRHEGLPGLLRDVATPDERRKLYAGLGISLSYERRSTGGQTRELIRPSLSPLESHPTPWSNSPCRRGCRRSEFWLHPNVSADIVVASRRVTLFARAVVNGSLKLVTKSKDRWTKKIYIASARPPET